MTSEQTSSSVKEKSETTLLSAVMPTLTVNDIDASLAWYRNVLGFAVVEEMKHDDKLVGGILRAGNVQFLLGQDDFAKGRDRKKGEGFRLYCVSKQDIDRLASEIKARGGILDQEPQDQPWGARDFAVVDPDGFKISISTGMSHDEKG